MNPVTLSGGALIDTSSYMQQAMVATGGTFSHNAGWFILIATAGLIFGIVSFLMGKLCMLGMRYYDTHGSLKYDARSNYPNGISDAYYATKYLNEGGDIKNASSQEFVRNWAVDYERRRYRSSKELQSKVGSEREYLNMIGFY